jgi:hypothetical protein
MLSNYISHIFLDKGFGSHSGASVLSREQILPLRQPKNGNKQPEFDVPLAGLVPGGSKKVDGNRENTLRTDQVPLGLDFHALLVVFTRDPELLHLLNPVISQRIVLGRQYDRIFTTHLVAGKKRLKIVLLPNAELIDNPDSAFKRSFAF